VNQSPPHSTEFKLLRLSLPPPMMPGLLLVFPPLLALPRALHFNKGNLSLALNLCFFLKWPEHSILPNRASYRSTYEVGPSSNQSSTRPNILGIDNLKAALQGLNLGHSPSSLVNIPPPNITSLVTIKLSTVEDFLTWRTQFTALRLSQNMLGFVDGTWPPPPSFVTDFF